VCPVHDAVLLRRRTRDQRDDHRVTHHPISKTKHQAEKLSCANERQLRDPATNLRSDRAQTIIRVTGSRDIRSALGANR
jgi:hypothetical protein